MSGDPTDWQVLLDPKYKGRIVVENQPEAIVAYMARAAGFAKPYDLTDDELATGHGLNWPLVVGITAVWVGSIWLRVTHRADFAAPSGSRRRR